MTQATSGGPRACDGETGLGLGATTVNQTAFQVLSNRILGAAYKPDDIWRFAPVLAPIDGSILRRAHDLRDWH